MNPPLQLVEITLPRRFACKFAFSLTTARKIDKNKSVKQAFEKGRMDSKMKEEEPRQRRMQKLLLSDQIRSVAQSCSTLCDLMNCRLSSVKGLAGA